MGQSKSLGLLFSLTTFISCVPQNPDKDPVSPLNGLVKEYGYIGHQNPLEESQTGTLIAGRPTAVSFVAHSQDCFPEEELPRYYDRSDFTKKYNYQFQGNLGFLTSGNPIVTAGLGLRTDHLVQLELSGITIQYMSSIDITRWYREGMDTICRDYLDQVGFIIQALSSEKLTLSIKKISGASIGLNGSNIAQYFNFETGVDWEIVDEYHVEITTPKFIGYQLGRLRHEDNGFSLFRAMTVKDDEYVFERIALFDDESKQTILMKQ